MSLKEKHLGLLVQDIFVQKKFKKYIYIFAFFIILAVINPLSALTLSIGQQLK